MQSDSQYTNERNYPPECLTSVQYSEILMLFLKASVREQHSSNLQIFILLSITRMLINI